ncbi:MAG TPA: ABC transporter ATP-binding protein [Myxococcota bacterium]|jgi:putative ABC transport system ATP-binding protein|nr:ABC transporter ATP-binding protein [Myxococcota bacterium]
MTGIAVQASELRVTYKVGSGLVHALAGIDLLVPEGQFLLVRGRSGSGKTTLLHVISGLLKPTFGTVRVGPFDVHSLEGREADVFRRRNVGLIFQFFNLIPTLTVEMNVALPLLLDGQKLPRLRGRIREILESLGLGHRLGHAPNQLSGGEMQRVAIARALIIEPKIILADEPTGNLDSRTAHDVLALLRQQVTERRVTMVVMTHEVNATTYADRVIEMSDGRILTDTWVASRSPKALDAR